MKQIVNSNLGYPRIGNNREWKKLLERYWSHELTEVEFHEEMKQLRLSNLLKQKNKGIDMIPVGDFTYYDHILDHAMMFGIIPERFKQPENSSSLNLYFSMARGNKNAQACEMTKWFNTNYHYIVPEFNQQIPSLVENLPLKAYLEAKDELGIKGKPVIVGPYTFIKLCKGYDEADFLTMFKKILPVYQQLFSEMEGAGVEWVQVDEPYFVTQLSHSDFSLINSAYDLFNRTSPSLKIMLQTYFDSIERYLDIINLPVKGIGLDFVHGSNQNLEALKTEGFPKDKYLGVGVIDGRNIWRSDLKSKLDILQEIREVISNEQMIIQTSCSLLHVPINLDKETKLDSIILNNLAFADEKLDELVTLTRGINLGTEEITVELKSSSLAIKSLSESKAREPEAILKRVLEYSKSRTLNFEQRYQLQKGKFCLPPLPTTTIGSLPQTSEVRKTRQLYRKGEYSEEVYNEFIENEIKKWINIQEEIGLDVLVHGEFERTDMVEFFGEKLEGFAFTQNGWVQSYGSRCVKPPIIYGNVQFIAPMTVKEILYAQSLTSKPVKGMLTGPVTILNWSFVRDDISRKSVSYQIALALREEVEALERIGIGMIQVDEPALREGFPLKPKEKDSYLNWAVVAFRLATSGVSDATQIHTHMCYCDFHDMIDAIRDMDSDVISIETSRSHGEIIQSFENNTYKKGIGLGVYDIHSPRVPSKHEIVSLVKRALKVLPRNLFWINPDCGLKTRGTEETLESLRIMVEAAHEIRKDLADTNDYKNELSL